jgi:molecular chaperone DnaK
VFAELLNLTRNYVAIAIGIDLGTTNSCAAVMESGQPRVITTGDGSTAVPSVFAIDAEGQELVGEVARLQAQDNPTGTVQAAKRLIGRNFHSKSINETRQIFTYEMVEGHNEEVLVQVQEQLYTLEQISAAILSRVKDVAEHNIREQVEQAVITVPAYFNERQRASVREAGRMAGFEVLRILNEPTAAVLAYGHGQQLHQRVAVYDLGGGTFDISIIDIEGRVYEVVATGGDTFLGGVDFDDRLMKFVLEDFHTKNGVDLSFNRVAIQRIRDAAEAAKIALSTHDAAHIQLENITDSPQGPLDVDLTISRAQLEQLTVDLVKRTIATCRRIMEEAGTSPGEIHEFLMVGGQSRMPLVHRAVTQMMGRPPNQTLDPEQAVSLGAAIMAHAVRRPAQSQITLRDVLPIPIGLRGAGDTMHVLFDKQCRLPARQHRTLTTSRDGQRSIMLKIYQGENELVDENVLIGTFVFSGIRIGAAGTVGLEVALDLNAEGYLKITAKDPTTNDQVQTKIRFDPSGRPPKPVKRIRRPMRPNTPAADEPIEDDLLPPGMPPIPLEMPTSTLVEEIEGELETFDSIDLQLGKDIPPPSLWRRFSQLFGRS